MAENPITTLLPADLPTNWVYGQTIAPDGSDVGLSKQHGYNYLMRQVNAAHTALKDVGDSFPLLALKSDITLKTLGVTATAKDLNYVKGVTGNIQTQLDKKLGSDGKAESAKEADAAAKLTTSRNINGAPFDGTKDINTKYTWNQRFTHSGNVSCVQLFSIPKDSSKAFDIAILCSISNNQTTDADMFVVHINRTSGASVNMKICKLFGSSNVDFYYVVENNIVNIYYALNAGYYRGHTLTILHQAFSLVAENIVYTNTAIDITGGIPTTWTKFNISVLQDQNGTVENANRIKKSEIVFSSNFSRKIPLFGGSATNYDSNA